MMQKINARCSRTQTQNSKWLIRNRWFTQKMFRNRVSGRRGSAPLRRKSRSYLRRWIPNARFVATDDFGYLLGCFARRGSCCVLYQMRRHRNTVWLSFCSPLPIVRNKASLKKNQIIFQEIDPKGSEMETFLLRVNGHSKILQTP